MQGAAFDLPDHLADELMEKKEELISRGFKVDLPTSLPIENIRGGGFNDSRGGRYGRGGGYGGRGQRSAAVLQTYLTILLKLSGMCNERHKALHWTAGMMHNSVSQQVSGSQRQAQ